jgi:hypothetical protein
LAWQEKLLQRQFEQDARETTENRAGKTYSRDPLDLPFNLSQKNYQQKTLRRFRPSPEVYYTVANTILLNGKNTLPSPKPTEWGQLSHRKDTTYISFAVLKLGIKDPTPLVTYL